MGKKYFFAILASIAIVIFFQNCGDIRLSPGSESINSTPDPLSCVDPSGSSPTVVVSSLSEADQSILNAYVLETRLSDNQTLTSTRTFEWSFDESPQPAGANLSFNVAQLVACSTHKVTAKWIDSCSQPQELTQIYTQYGEGCPPPPAEPLPEPTPTPTPLPAGLTCDSSITRQAAYAAQIGINDTVVKALKFAATPGTNFTMAYPSANYVVAISKTPCDFSAVETPNCWRQGTRQFIITYSTTGTTGCVLDATSDYYVNVRAATYNATTKVFTPSCGAGKTCTFRPY